LRVRGGRFQHVGGDETDRVGDQQVVAVIADLKLRHDPESRCRRLVTRCRIGPPGRSAMTGFKMNDPERPKVPITILTGFPGSGKTTLLNYILTERHAYRIAMIENEFGEIDVDSDLVLASDEESYQMQNGCICCVLDARNDLIDVMKKLLARSDRFEHVIVETSGLADPTPVATAFFVDPEVRDAVRLDAIVTLADAAHVGEHLHDPMLDGKENQALNQVVAADRIILNKIDLASADRLDRLDLDLRKLNEELAANGGPGVRP
jgi:G3E family GTPase